MPTTQGSGPPEYVLTLELLVDAPVGNVWHCWTEPELLEEWFCPKPWYVTDARIDLRPGGEFSSVMHGPNGEEVQNVGVFLGVEPGRCRVMTDAFRPGWIPGGRAFMVAEILLCSHWGWEDLLHRPREALGRGGTERARGDGLSRGVGEGRRPARGACPVDLAHEPGRRTKEKAPKVGTCRWSGDQALLAAEFYCTILPGSRIGGWDGIRRWPERVEPGKVLIVEFTLVGTPYQALNSGPHFELDEVVSVSV